MTQARLFHCVWTPSFDQVVLDPESLVSDVVVECPYQLGTNIMTYYETHESQTVDLRGWLCNLAC